MLNLDTHIVLNLFRDELSASELSLVKNKPLGISAIVLWEITKLFQLRRISLSLDDPTFAELLSYLHVWPITAEVCRATLMLDFQSDPADELIAATSLTYKVPLLTRDSKILQSQRVPLAL